MGGELWGQHCSPRVFSVRCVPCPADGHGNLRPMRVRNVPEGRRSCALVRTVTREVGVMKGMFRGLSTLHRYQIYYCDWTILQYEYR